MQRAQRRLALDDFFQLATQQAQSLRRQHAPVSIAASLLATATLGVKGAILRVTPVAAATPGRSAATVRVRRQIVKRGRDGAVQLKVALGQRLHGFRGGVHVLRGI